MVKRLVSLTTESWCNLFPGLNRYFFI